MAQVESVVPHSGDPEVTHEVERKLTVPDAFGDADLTGALQKVGPVVRQRPVKLVAVYYDTSDHRLARARITLRRRTGGDSGWHLKLPPDDLDSDLREEVVLPLAAGGPGRVPSSLAALVIGVTGSHPLEVQATQQTRRTPWWVMADDGGVGVEVVDDEVSVVGGSQTGLHYRELEVEVKSTPSLLPIAVDALVAAGAAPSTSLSKGVRAMVGDVSLPPLVQIGERPRPKQPAGDAVRHHLRTQVSAILTQDLRVRRNRPDAVHQFRVAARRLRSVLQAFAPLVDEDWSRELRAELGWIASVLSQARDREVLEERLTEAVRALPAEVDGAAALVAIRQHLDAELVEAQAGIDEAMTSDRYVRLVDALHGAVDAPPLTQLAERKASTVLPPLADRAWQRLEKQGRRLHRELEGHDDHWHRTRITAKRARYTVEACVPVFGGKARKLARQLEHVTELLGQHQDAAIAADLARQLALTTRGARTPFALGVLYAQQRAEVAALRREFVDTWPRVSAPEWRGWMTEAS